MYLLELAILLYNETIRLYWQVQLAYRVARLVQLSSLHAVSLNKKHDSSMIECGAH